MPPAAPITAPNIRRFVPRRPYPIEHPPFRVARAFLTEHPPVPARAEATPSSSIRHSARAGHPSPSILSSRGAGAPPRRASAIPRRAEAPPCRASAIPARAGHHHRASVIPRRAGHHRAEHPPIPRRAAAPPARASAYSASRRPSPRQTSGPFRACAGHHRAKHPPILATSCRTPLRRASAIPRRAGHHRAEHPPFRAAPTITAPNIRLSDAAAAHPPPRICHSVPRRPSPCRTSAHSRHVVPEHRFAELPPPDTHERAAHENPGGPAVTSTTAMQTALGSPSPADAERSSEPD